MSGKKYPQKRPKLIKETSLGFSTDICPFCEEEWPESLLVVHMSRCNTSSSRFSRNTLRESVQSFLKYDRPSSSATLLENDRSTHESSAYRTKRYMPPFSVSEEDDSKVGMAKAASNSKENTGSGLGSVRLIQNLENLLQNEWCSDVVLKNTDHEFHAHRLILGMRSPVFASMFQHDMIEKKTGEVDISDCSTAGFKAFLRFLYSGNADVSSVNVVDLFYIADKYQVDDLKAYCIEYMNNSLSIDTVCDVIALSVRHSESDLQSYAKEFFCRNIKVIVKTQQWQNFLTENPVLANELIIIALNA